VKHSLEPREKQAIAEFLDILVQRHGERVHQTMLFGSKARGDSGPASDIDLLIITDRDDWRLSHSISDIAADVSLEYNVIIGPRVIGHERWERMKRDRFTLYRNVTTDGIPLTRALDPVPVNPLA
jgi:uncharacterized protein